MNAFPLHPALQAQIEELAILHLRLFPAPTDALGMEAVVAEFRRQVRLLNESILCMMGEGCTN